MPIIATQEKNTQIREPLKNGVIPNVSINDRSASIISLQKKADLINMSGVVQKWSETGNLTYLKENGLLSMRNLVNRVETNDTYGNPLIAYDVQIPTEKENCPNFFKGNKIQVHVHLKSGDLDACSIDVKSAKEDENHNYYLFIANYKEENIAHFPDAKKIIEDEYAQNEQKKNEIARNPKNFGYFGLAYYTMK